MEEFRHYTVMKKEAVDALNCVDGKIYIDCTLGGGGHSEEILKKIQPTGKLIAFDVDEEAINYAKHRLSDFKNLIIIKDSYTKLKETLKSLNINKITGGVLLDVGASYHQLTKKERGFSFSKEAKLDMRFDLQADFSAYELINTYKEDELVEIFSKYGQERFSKRIAKAIVQQRKIAKIETTTELSQLIIDATPRIKSKIHPATRVFQAIRIEVNNELRNIKNVLEDIVQLCDVGAIISVISFHSLEGSLVKNFFRDYSKGYCPLNEPIENYREPLLKLITKKPIKASESELNENPPSRSAELRIAQKV